MEIKKKSRTQNIMESFLNENIIKQKQNLLTS